MGGFTVCGVPLGSILGPLLFLLYDLPEAVVSDPVLYADDSCLVFQHKSIIKIKQQAKVKYLGCSLGLLLSGEFKRNR